MNAGAVDPLTNATVTAGGAAHLTARTLADGGTVRTGWDGRPVAPPGDLPLPLEEADRVLAQVLFAQFHHPVLLLDDRRVIRAANGQARRILQTSEALQERGGMLACASPEDTRALADALRHVRSGPLDEAPRREPRRTTLRVRGAHGLHVHLFVSGVPAEECLWMPSLAVCALVLIHDPLHVPDRPDPVLVAEAFSLTPAEARVAVRLADGWTVKDIAQEHRTSISTVRSQVHQALQKVGVSRQADLVRLLLAFPFRQRP